MARSLSSFYTRNKNQRFKTVGRNTLHEKSYTLPMVFSLSPGSPLDEDLFLDLADNKVYLS